MARHGTSNKAKEENREQYEDFELHFVARVCKEKTTIHVSDISVLKLNVIVDSMACF